MDKSSNLYTVVFSTAICVICAALLAVTFEGLQSTIEGNKKLDIQKNILKASGLWDPLTDTRTDAELSELYAERVTEMVVSRKTGEVIQEPGENGELENKKPVLQELRETGLRKQGGDEATYPEELAVFEVKVGDGIVYCLPMSQYGLWSWLHGFIAVGPDGREVRGITYYEQGETPGLGGEVENPNWQEQWEGKTLYSPTGEFVGITVKKGKVDPGVEREARSWVDGLAGATITSNGVMRDLKVDIRWYDAFFDRKRG